MGALPKASVGAAMESGFGNWMNDSDLEELNDAIDEQLIEGLDFEEAIALGGLFGAAIEEIEREENEVVELGSDLEDCFDELDECLMSDKAWAPLYYDNPEFARFVYKSVEKAMEEADKKVAMKRGKLKDG